MRRIQQESLGQVGGDRPAATGRYCNYNKLGSIAYVRDWSLPLRGPGHVIDVVGPSVGILPLFPTSWQWRTEHMNTIKTLQLNYKYRYRTNVPTTIRINSVVNPDSVGSRIFFGSGIICLGSGSGKN